ncbi:hypothetical protein NQ318_023395 [Aromia moschata]|uniref:Uncharacterized protein n=1 Tax=Aromia moschata TaxID=1265417 RepID=A0AAV8YVP2_9CUCU|nr:hypothetical protein NQ318_023395 [Aromia moschata]
MQDNALPSVDSLQLVKEINEVLHAVDDVKNKRVKESSQLSYRKTPVINPFTGQGFQNIFFNKLIERKDDYSRAGFGGEQYWWGQQPLEKLLILKYDEIVKLILEKY